MPAQQDPSKDYDWMDEGDVQNGNIAKEQAGYVEGRGMRQQIANITMIIEKYSGCSIPLYICFIGYDKIW